MRGVASSSGADALRLLKSVKSSIVLCDIDLPDMSGLELLQSVRSVHPEATFLTCAEPKTLRDALLAMIAGASGFITTRQDFQAVARQLETAVRRSSLIRRFQNSEAQQRISTGSNRQTRAARQSSGFGGIRR